MKQFNVLNGTIAATTFFLVLSCVQANAELIASDYDGNNTNGISLVVADNTAIGGDAPNPEQDRSASTVVDDSSITAKVKSKLLADSTVGGMKIDVDTINGVVYLTSDHMKSQAEISQAIKVASEISGVKRVESKMAIGE